MADFISKKIIVQKANCYQICKALDFYEDEDKSQEENLIDCLVDHGFELSNSDHQYLVFSYCDDASGDDEYFDWEFIHKIARFLDEKTVVEEYIPQMEDLEGRIYRGVLAGTVENGELVRTCYEVIKINDAYEKKYIEIFDKNLERQ